MIPKPLSKNGKDAYTITMEGETFRVLLKRYNNKGLEKRMTRDVITHPGFQGFSTLRKTGNIALLFYRNGDVFIH